METQKGRREEQTNPCLMRMEKMLTKFSDVCVCACMCVSALALSVLPKRLKMLLAMKLPPRALSHMLRNPDPVWILGG